VGQVLLERATKFGRSRLIVSRPDSSLAPIRLTA
jgi:hypothetical protein